MGCECGVVPSLTVITTSRPPFLRDLESMTALHSRALVRYLVASHYSNYHYTLREHLITYCEALDDCQFGHGSTGIHTSNTTKSCTSATQSVPKAMDVFQSPNALND